MGAAHHPAPPPGCCSEAEQPVKEEQGRRHWGGGTAGLDCGLDSLLKDEKKEPHTLLGAKLSPECDQGANGHWQQQECGQVLDQESSPTSLLGKVDLDASSFTSEELKKALAKMKEQLKEEFEKLNMKIETDYEIMVKLISKFNSSASTLDEKVAALYDLEYYVHQVDNAKDFLSMGGLRLVIEGLNSSEALLKEHAAFVLGAALSR
ncbi:nucleotide exchange factor SIL1-like [Ammospiza maritima maritima]